LRVFNPVFQFTKEKASHISDSTREHFELFLDELIYLCCILHTGFKNVVRKIQLDVIIFSAALRFYVFPFQILAPAE
jgi:hypothetical protein